MTKQEEIVEDILKWYNNKKYVRIGSDISVTEMMMPMQLVQLRDRHRQQIDEDSLDAILPALIGTATHDMLQKFLRRESDVSGKYLIERRMLSIVQGLRLAGRFDILQNQNTILDIKVTRVWKYIFGGTSEWEEQLNTYRWMLAGDGYKIKRLRVMMVLLDWQKVKTYHDPKYPKSRIQFVEINRWPMQTTENYVNDRVSQFIKSKTLADDRLPKCTESERWANDAQYKLYRTQTQKTATKVFDSLKRATAYELKCKQNDPKKWSGSHIKTFRGMPWKRCESFCAASKFCHQYKNRII